MNAASETATAMIQGLPLGRQSSSPEMPASAALTGRSRRFDEQARDEFEEAALSVRFQLIEYTLDVGGRGDELRAFLGHCSQESLSSPVDERDRTEIDCAGAFVLRAMSVFPACSQLGDPRLDQSTFDRPPLFGGCFRNSDSQHFSSSLLLSYTGDRPEISAEPGSTADSRDDRKFLMPTSSRALAHMHF
jgi:hypothetical protein